MDFKSKSPVPPGFKEKEITKQQMKDEALINGAPSLEGRRYNERDAQRIAQARAEVRNDREKKKETISSLASRVVRPVREAIGFYPTIKKK